MKAATVWERAAVSSRDHAMSKGLFAFTICGFTLLGIIASFVAAQISIDWTFANTWQLLGFSLGVLVVGMIGVVISFKSDNPVVSLLGYALVAIPFGLLLGPILAAYTAATITKVLFVTTALVAVLGLVGAMIPDSLEGLGSWLLGGLTILIVGYLAVPIAGAFGIDVGGALTWLDWLGVGLFSVMVVYDWNRAMRIPRTLDNAIDSSVAIYLDWFNLFIRLLAIMGGRSND